MSEQDSHKVERWKVPESWQWVRIGDVCQVVGGGTPSTKDPTNFENGHIPWITPADLSGYKDKFIRNGKRDITQKGLESSSATPMPKGTVLFSSRAPIGYVAIAENEVTTNQGFKSFIPPDGLSSEYLYYYLQRARDLAIELSSGTTFREISAKRAGMIPLPIAPANEQRCIAAKIEELFSDLDAGVAALERAKANLARYRASVLKAAVEGKLTEQWRAENPDVEPASELLQRILVERRKKWEEEQLAKYEAQGKKPPKNWQSRYKEPVEPDVLGLPELPDGWCWIMTDQVLHFVTSGSRGWAKYYSEEGNQFLRVGNLDRLSISLDLNEVQCVNAPEGAESRRTRVKSEDILISITADTGMIGLIPCSFDEAYVNQHIAIGRAVECIFRPYLAWVLASQIGQQQFTSLQRGLTKSGLGLDDIRNVATPLPPLREQKEIVAQIDEDMSFAKSVETTCAISLKRTSSLRQSILHKAFQGSLVQQDLLDAPAEDLLKSVKANRREIKSSVPKPRRKPRKKSNAKRHTDDRQQSMEFRPRSS